MATRTIRPAGYKNVDVPRSSSGVDLRKQRRGSVVPLYKDGIIANKLVFEPTPSTFELVGATMTSSRSTFVTIVVYRPGGEPCNTQFFDELSAVLEQVATYSCPVVVTGDLNLQLDVIGGSDARRLQEVLDTFGLC